MPWVQYCRTTVECEGILVHVPFLEAPNLYLTRKFKLQQMFDRWGRESCCHTRSTVSRNIHQIHDVSCSMAQRESKDRCPQSHKLLSTKGRWCAPKAGRLTFASHVRPLQLKFGATASCFVVSNELSEPLSPQLHSWRLGSASRPADVYAEPNLALVEISVDCFANQPALAD